MHDFYLLIQTLEISAGCGWVEGAKKKAFFSDNKESRRFFLTGLGMFLPGTSTACKKQCFWPQLAGGSWIFTGVVVGAHSSEIKKAYIIYFETKTQFR